MGCSPHAQSITEMWPDKHIFPNATIFQWERNKKKKILSSQWVHKQGPGWDWWAGMGERHFSGAAV